MLSFRKDYEMAQMGSKLEDEQSLIIQLQKKIKELQVSTVLFSTPNQSSPLLVSVKKMLHCSSLWSYGVRSYILLANGTELSEVNDSE